MTIAMLLQRAVLLTTLMIVAGAIISTVRRSEDR
jgi:hypothetical protein